MNDVIRIYFSLGFQQQEILTLLAIHHNILISTRTLKRKLRFLNLSRRKNYTDINHLYTFIEENVRTHNQLHGYKWMHLKCIQNDLVTTQDTVRQLLHIIDPEGVDLRRRRRLRRRQYKNKGPNFLWHMDCYDKLKPFGICISGCIDGFSRCIIWLRAGKTSSDPEVITSYYLDEIKRLSGCPHTVRADLGTENGIVCQVQNYLRNEDNHSNNPSLPPFLYGTSPANQRIEAWWSVLRKHHSQFWMNLFHKLKDEGLFSGSFLDKSLIQFCFLGIIQNELDTVVKEWNTHRISGSRNSVSPRGRPVMMYYLPQVYGAINYLQPVEDKDIQVCQHLATFPSRIPCDPDVYNVAAIITNEKQLVIPKNHYEGLNLYIVLREELLSIL